jgi:L-ascorbate metabolism protein UlaG (beta-lactamase superfamily)
VADSFTFIGNATALVRLGPFTLLTEPNFLHIGQRAYLGHGLVSKRLKEPALRVDELPALDAVVLSHRHGDHWDRAARRGLDRALPVITTLHAARRLRTLDRFPAAHGLDTWQRHTLAEGRSRPTVTALPGRHAPGIAERLLPPVMGSLLEHRIAGRVRHRLYISGDTLTGEHVSQIAVRHPDIDTLVVHLGGTRVLWHTVTMDAEQGVDFLRRIPAQAAVPVHHDDYGVFRSPLGDFLARTEQAGCGQQLRQVRRGETILLG